MALLIILILVPMLIGWWAQMRVSSAFNHWKEVGASSGLTGAEAAQRILMTSGIRDVEVVPIEDMLGDHYDPSKKVLCLSQDVYNGTSVAAIGIAAHECGHAIQHQKAYAPLHLRMAIVPVTQLASGLLPIVALGGWLFFAMPKLALLAVAVYLILMIFQLVTLPVEFDASRRAKVIVQQLGMIQPGEETKGVDNVLNAAALTYVAAFVVSLGWLFYYLSIFMGQRGEER